jgi:ketosteroid isomerase-like protein
MLPLVGVQRPEDINAAFAEAVNACDVDALVALYVPDGVVVNPDRSVSTGHEEIAAHAHGLLELGGRMTSINEYAVVNGDVALVGARFVIEFDDGRDSIGGRTAEVLVRSDGEWLYLIDHPFAFAG